MSTTGYSRSNITTPDPKQSQFFFLKTYIKIYILNEQGWTLARSLRKYQFHYLHFTEVQWPDRMCLPIQIFQE